VIGVDLFLGAPPGLPGILLGQPALWSVPLAFATMVLVSLRGRPPAWASAAMLRLHLDETENSAVPNSSGPNSPGPGRR
jgi:cation/acetate symporter